MPVISSRGAPTVRSAGRTLQHRHASQVEHARLLEKRAEVTTRSKTRAEVIAAHGIKPAPIAQLVHTFEMPAVVKRSTVDESPLARQVRTVGTGHTLARKGRGVTTHVSATPSSRLGPITLRPLRDVNLAEYAKRHGLILKHA